MNRFKSTAIFLFACAAICLIIAIERYQSAVATAKTVASQLDGVEYEASGIPLVSTVTGFVAVMFFVAGIRLLLEGRKAKTSSDQMLQVPSDP
jgi:preprotein translocase subunit SecG